MAACPMAWARWLFPVPGGPKNKASSCRAMNAAVARSKIRLRFVFLLKLKSKLSSVFCASRNCACFLRRSSSRSLRRVSSSETRQEMKSMGAIGSAWPGADASRARQQCRRGAVFVTHCLIRSDSFWLLLKFEIDEVAILGEFTNEGIDLPGSQLWTALEL